MATTQYIGARYVPKFYENSSHTAEWTANTAYEPLTIVTRNGNSYTSRKTVPAATGAPEDNPTYWASTGIYDEQIEEYREETAAVAEALEDLEDVVYSKERHVAIICDSYGTYNGAGAGYEVSYNILDRLITYTGWNNSYFHYSAQNGAGMCNGNFLSQLNAMSVDADVAPLVTDLYVLGGWNDESDRDGVSEAAFNTAAADFKTAAATKFPNAKLHVCFCAWYYGTARDNQAIRTTRNWYFALAKSGWVIEYSYEYIMHNSAWFIGGNVHPNQDGVNQLALGLGQIIMNGKCRAFYTTTTTTTSDMIGTLPGSASLRMQQTMYDGLVYVQIHAVRGCITLTDATTQLICDGNHTVTPFKFTGNQIIKGYAVNCVTGCTIQIYDGTNRYDVPAELYLVDGDVKIILGYVPAGSTYLTVNNVTKITIPSLGFTCKAW